MAHSLKILQWNVNGFRAKCSLLMAIARTRDIDVIMLQETGIKGQVRFSGYHPFVLASTPNTRGCITLVKASIPCTQIDNPISCGEGVEVLAVKIRLARESLTLYNIYKKPQNRMLEIGEVCALASQELILIGGDFNAHHPILSSPKTNEAGIHIAEVLESCPEIALLNNGEPTHTRGGRLDLTLVTATLSPRVRWEVDPTITSDHYGINITIQEADRPPTAPHVPRWNTKHANWGTFKNVLAEWCNAYSSEAEDVDTLEAEFTAAINEAADQAIPKTTPRTRTHRDSWYYNEEIKEANHRVNMFRKNFRRNRLQVNLDMLNAAAREARETATRVRHDKWLEWCASFDCHTSLSELWGKLRVATNRSQPRKTHHAPSEEAERLALEFSMRTQSSSLPVNVRQRQDRLSIPRMANTQVKKAEPDCTDREFTVEELKKTRKTSSDTAPGSDLITHSIISNLGPAGELAFLRIINASWKSSKLPSSWKRADIVPIPKPKEKGKYRPISLLSCLGKTAERMVLNRLLWKLGTLHEDIHAFTKGMSTAHSLATLLSIVSKTSAVVVFLDLEKAFELASPHAILETLVRKGVKGKLLAWIEDYLKDRTARVRFQGHLSEFYNLENGTPQGGVLSPTLFNVLMVNILELPLPNGCKIISYADDLALIVTGKGNKFQRAQLCLNDIEDESCRIGLKISAAKSKAMTFGLHSVQAILSIQGIHLEWVRKFQYLGVWIDDRLQFEEEIRYLKARAIARTTVMRVMSGREIGAGHEVLRTFYVHAVRSIVDYASPALVTLSPALRDKLEPLQNDAARSILGAPQWTKTLNLRVEANLMPLSLRIDKLAACFLAKIIQTPRDTELRRKIVTSLERDPELFQPPPWEQSPV